MPSFIHIYIYIIACIWRSCPAGGRLPHGECFLALGYEATRVTMLSSRSENAADIPLVPNYPLSYSLQPRSHICVLYGCTGSYWA